MTVTPRAAPSRAVTLFGTEEPVAPPLIGEGRGDGGELTAAEPEQLYAPIVRDFGRAVSFTPSRSGARP